jgi:hypothetical protein
MEEQSYAKHTRIVPLFHMVLFGLIVVAFFGSLWNLYKHMSDTAGRTTVVLLVIITFAMILQFFFSRTFPLKAQDRAIRAEENLRHFAMTGKLLDPGLTMRQIIALRFASDAEFVDLARRAGAEKLSSDAIKKSIKKWRADNHRV